MNYSCASPHPRCHSRVSPSHGLPSVPAANPRAYSSDVVSTSGSTSGVSLSGLVAMIRLDAGGTVEGSLLLRIAEVQGGYAQALEGRASDGEVNLRAVWTDAVPKDDVQAKALSIMRKALAQTNTLGIGEIAFSGREHLVAIGAPLDPKQKGLMLVALKDKRSFSELSGAIAKCG